MVFIIMLIILLKLFISNESFLDLHWRCLTKNHLIVHWDFIVHWICICFFIRTIWDICTSGGNILTISCTCIYISNRSRLNISIVISPNDRPSRLLISLLLGIIWRINNSLPSLLDWLLSVISRLTYLVSRSVLILNVVLIGIRIEENRTLGFWTWHRVSYSCIEHDWFIAVDGERLFILGTSPT